MNVITETNAVVPVTKTFVEPDLVKNFRKSLNVILESFKDNIKIEIASMFDECLNVGLADAVNATPIISSVNADKFLYLVRSKFDFGSTFSLNLANAVTKLNLALINTRQNTRYVLVPLAQKHLIPLYISGNSNDVDYEAIAGMCTHVGYERTINCLVFYYGLRVKHAEQLFKAFNP